MRKHVKGLVAAMEEEAVIAEAAMAEASEPAADSVETDLIEISEDAAEGDQDAAEVEEAGEVSEALEAMYDVMATAAANGGLDRHGAQLAGIAIDHLCKRVGIKKTSMPALESFGGTSSRVGATQLAMEDVKEQLSKIWEAIKEAIKKSIEWIKATFMKIFDAATKLDERGKKLAAQADKTTGSVKEGKIENEGIAKAICVGGKVAANATGATFLKDTAKIVYSGVADLAGKKGEEIASVLEAADSNIPSDWLDKMGTDLGPAPGTAMVSNVKDYAEVPEGHRLSLSKELPGNRAIMTIMAGEGKGGADAVLGHKTKLAQFNPKQGDVPAELPVLSVADAKKIAEDISELAKEVLAYKAKVDAIGKIKERIVKAADKLGKRAPKEGEEDSLRTVEKVVRSSASQLDAPMAEFSVYSLKTGNAFLQYVELSLKQYGG